VTRARPGPTRTAERGHEAVGHTADARIRAWAPSLALLYEEAAAALAGLTAAVRPGTSATAWLDVEVTSDDLERLAYAWLNELIGLADVECAGIVASSVVGLWSGRGGAGDAAEEAAISASWHLVGRIGIHPFDELDVRALRQVKAATMHGLRVQSGPEGWLLEAVLDM
jgi:SHS2 domain-containing protein